MLSIVAKPKHLLAVGRAAFTLLEIVISLAVLGTMASGCYVGFNAINAYAVGTRLYSEALTAAQNQTDLVLSKEPFDLMAAYLSGSFDPSLNFPTSAPSAAPAKTNPYYPYYPYYRPPGANQALTKDAFIYSDPTSGKVIVRGTLTTSVTDTAMTMSFVNATPTNLNTRRVTTTVAYNFRGRDYAVSIDTLRSADQ